MLSRAIGKDEKCGLGAAVNMARAMAEHVARASDLACVGTPQERLDERYKSIIERMDKTFHETHTDFDGLTWGDVRAMWLRVCKQIVAVLEEEG